MPAKIARHGAGTPPVRKKGTFRRVVKALFRYYPRMMPIALACVVFNAVVSALPSIFMERVFSVVGEAVKLGAGWGSSILFEGATIVVGEKITGFMLTLIGLYILSLIATGVYHQLLAIITQGFLKKMRGQMFNGMQELPIRYFDTHNHGDIMSYYTNDIDALRQMIGQSVPQLITSGVMVVTLFGIMLYYSFWLALIVLGGVGVILFVTKIVGGGAGKYFLGQQRAVAKTEGFVEEMMNGQKVVKVFCHEEAAKADFDKVNEHLFDQSNRANRYANMLMPILGNFGHVLYVIIAVVGCVFVLESVNNVGFITLLGVEGGTFAVANIVSFLQMTRQFTNNVNQVSNQVNSVVMGLAGSARVMALIDEEPEKDEGYGVIGYAERIEGARQCP